MELIIVVGESYNRMLGFVRVEYLQHVYDVGFIRFCDFQHRSVS